MSGWGAPPQEQRSRARDTPVRENVRSDGKIGGYELPEGVLPPLMRDGEYEYDIDGNIVREQWHPQTVKWWESWRLSPQATRMITDVDWDYLLDTALLHHQMWESGGKNSERAAEIRLRVAAFGATYADRLRLKFEIETPTEEFDVGVTGAHVTNMDDERKRRLAGGR